MTLDFSNRKYFLISIVGSHAGEDATTIFSRKQRELKDNGGTYWLLKSFKAKTRQIQSFCKKAEQGGEEIHCLFIDSSSKNGARPTMHNTSVTHISHNGTDWGQLPLNMRMTGKIDLQSSALVLDELELFDKHLDIDLWDFSEFETGGPVELQLGASTVCCIRKPSNGMKSRHRKIIARGKLTYPHAVFVS
mgnify:FL=1